MQIIFVLSRLLRNLLLRQILPERCDRIVVVSVFMLTLRMIAHKRSLITWETYVSVCLLSSWIPCHVFHKKFHGELFFLSFISKRTVFLSKNILPSPTGIIFFTLFSELHFLWIVCWGGKRSSHFHVEKTTHVMWNTVRCMWKTILLYSWCMIIELVLIW
jgi:hypothetical protein